MGRATLEDAFNAAAGFARQGLGFLTEIKRYELDTALFEQSIELGRAQDELIADYARVGDGENIFQQDAAAYQGHILQRLAEWRGRADKAGNGSAYYTDALNRLERQAIETMQRRYTAAGAETDRQRADVATAKRYSAIDNSGRPVPETLADKMAVHEERKRINRMSPADEYKDKAVIFNTEFRRSLDVDTGGMDTAAALAALEKNIADFEAASAKYLAEGETADGFLTGKQEQLADARNAVRLAVWKRNYTRGEAADNEYRRILSDAQKTGDQALWRRAQAMHREGARLRENAKKEAEKNGEYSRDHLPQIAHWFPEPQELKAAGGGESGAGRSEENIATIRDIISRTREEEERAWAAGRGTSLSRAEDNLEERKAQFADFFFGLTRSYGIDDDRARYLFGREARLDHFWSDLRSTINEIDPRYEKAALPAINSLVGSIAKNNKLSTEDQQTLIRQIGQEMYDFIGDVGLKHLTPEGLIERARGIATRAVSNQSALMSMADPDAVRNLTGSGGTRELIRLYEEAYNSPEAVSFANGQYYFIGHESNYNAFRDAAVADVSKTLDIEDARKAGRVTVTADAWFPEAGRRGDVIPVPVITVSGAGSKDGKYIQQVAEERNARGIAAGKKLVLKKLGSSETGMVTAFEGSGDQAVQGRARDAEQERKTTNYKNDAKTEISKVLSEPNERERKRMWQNVYDAYFEFDADMSGKAGDKWLYYEDEMYLRGYDPQTLKPATAISKQRYDDLLMRHPEHRNRIQKELRGLLPPRDRGGR